MQPRTFWYTQEYILYNGTYNWNTRIVNFKFPTCGQTYTLTVSKSGTGNGTITSTDGFINCGQVCTASYLSGTQVTLTATPSQGSSFSSWSGCDSTNGNSCTLTMNGARTVTATFVLSNTHYTLSVSTNGYGTVTSTDGFINCPGTCSHYYLINTQVTLNATPTQGWAFAGWSGACSGTGACNLTMNQDLSVGATFAFPQILTTLYNFCSQPNCSDGSDPTAALVQAKDGNFYGTTFSGGANSNCTWGCGTVFKITAGGTLTTLYSFSGPDGEYPYAGLVQASDGNFYGTASWGGGGGNCSEPPSYSGCGTVFKITPGGMLTTLYTFAGPDGANPYGGLVQGSDGNFYGTTYGGGCQSDGCGTVFKITPSGALTTLYSFCSQSSCADGGVPNAGLVQAADGNFYGTTTAGWVSGRRYSLQNHSDR